MGCDIHAYIEGPDPNEQVAWQPRLINATLRYPMDPTDDPSYALSRCYELDIDRYYGLFESLAGVRSTGRLTPVAAGRGLPPDTSAAVRLVYDSWGQDAHSASWATSDEVQEALRQLWPNGDVPANLGLPALTTEERLVFWFDN